MRTRGTGARDEIAVLNTWFDSAQVTSEGAALGKLLCEPSKGQFDPDLFATRCGNQGNEAVVLCAGDKPRVRFALANYSTGAVDAYAMLYFSDNVALDETVDVISPSYFYVNPTAAQSARYGMVFEVPNLGGASGTWYWPIVKVVASGRSCPASRRMSR